MDDTRGLNLGCRACQNAQKRRRTGSGHHSDSPGVPDHVVARFRSMYLDGSWRAWSTLVADDLAEGMARLMAEEARDG